MTTQHSFKTWACLSIAGLILAVDSDANAQFRRGNSSQYNPASSGGTYVPGLTNRYSFAITPRGPLSVNIPLGGNVYASWPFYPGQSVINVMTQAGNLHNTSVISPASWPRGAGYYPTNIVYSGTISNSGYRTGGAYASPSSSRSSIDYRTPTPEKAETGGIVVENPVAAPVDQPRNAFNRWVNQRDRQGQPDIAQRNDEELNRNLTQPELKDVISGDALNVILQSLISMPDKVKKTAPIEFEENTLKQLNFTRGTGSIGLLRFEGRIDWPKAMQVLPAIATARQDIETRFADAYKNVTDQGRVDAIQLDDLLKRVDQLSDQLTANGKALTFAENVAAKRFLSSLEDSIKFLKQPDAADWLPGKSKLMASTVQELVEIMAQKRIRFAPALVGNDQVNISTHLMLVRLHKQAALNR